MRQFGHQPLTGAQVQWGLEHLNISAAYLKELGRKACCPAHLSCHDHEGGGGVKFQQWDGTRGRCSPTGWRRIRRWCGRWWRRRAARYAQEKGITPRDCP